MQPELLAIVQGLLDVAVDIKKGMKSGGVVAAILADADLMSKIGVIAGNLGNIPSDVKSLSVADIAPLLQVLIPGVEAIIAA